MECWSQDMGDKTERGGLFEAYPGKASHPRKSVTALCGTGLSQLIVVIIRPPID